MKVRKRLLWTVFAMVSSVIAFQIYVEQIPTVRCVIVNEKAQTVIKEKGDRCYQLADNEEAVIVTTDGVSVVSNPIE